MTLYLKRQLLSVMPVTVTSNAAGFPIWRWRRMEFAASSDSMVPQRGLLGEQEAE